VDSSDWSFQLAAEGAMRQGIEYIDFVISIV